MELPGNAECCWVARAGETDYPQPHRSARTTVAVVGAGIVGLTVACLLAQAGVPVTVVEGRRIGRAVTGRSTAKITTQHGLIHADLIRKLGRESASLYAQANSSAMRQIRDWIGKFGIDCDLARRDAYAYTCRPERRAAIEAEVRAARSLGLPAEAVSAAPLPFATAGAVRFADQAQFNPVSYLVGLSIVRRIHCAWATTTKVRC